MASWGDMDGKVSNLGVRLLWGISTGGQKRRASAKDGLRMDYRVTSVFMCGEVRKQARE